MGYNLFVAPTVWGPEDWSLMTIVALFDLSYFGRDIVSLNKLPCLDLSVKMGWNK